MRASIRLFLTILASTVPVVAMADDPKDMTMRSAAARARDREMTREANLSERAVVRRRDVRDAQRSRVTRIDSDRYEAADGEYAAASRDHGQAMETYQRRRQQYERELAEWRRSVAACRDGDYAACGN